MSKDYEAPDSDFYGAPEHRELSTAEFHELLYNSEPVDFRRLERAACPDNAYDEKPPEWSPGSFEQFETRLAARLVKMPPTWEGTPSGRSTRTMEEFLKTNFPNGMYIPSYMLHKRD